MSNETVNDARDWYQHLIYVAGGLLLGFAIGVDVTRLSPRAASWFRSPAYYIALLLVFVGAWRQRRMSS
jgi:hypothetical protein